MMILAWFFLSFAKLRGKKEKKRKKGKKKKCIYTGKEFNDLSLLMILLHLTPTNDIIKSKIAHFWYCTSVDFLVLSNESCCMPEHHMEISLKQKLHENGE